MRHISGLPLYALLSLVVVVLAGCGVAAPDLSAPAQEWGSNPDAAVSSPIRTPVPSDAAGSSPEEDGNASVGPVAPMSRIDADAASTTGPEPVQYTYRIVNEYPHDARAFTQGLIFVDGKLYEGTGLYGRSSLRHVDLETGEVLELVVLPAHLFGEGITLFGDHLVQLTWKAGVGLVYSSTDLRKIADFTYPTEGWGITHDSTHLIMSDGTSRLYFLDPETYAEADHVDVFSPDGPVDQLNELEYVNGQVMANVWKMDRIAIIDPGTGRVTAWVDLSGLLGPEDRQQPVDVLNGIAYDPVGERLFVTGKLWPKLFEIELLPMDVKAN